MSRRVSWHGTSEECTALLRAINRFCTGGGWKGDHCSRGPLEERLEACAAHALLLDQRALDGLLWMRRIAPRLRLEEGYPVGDPA